MGSGISFLQPKFSPVNSSSSSSQKDVCFPCSCFPLLGSRVPILRICYSLFLLPHWDLLTFISLCLSLPCFLFSPGFQLLLTCGRGLHTITSFYQCTTGWRTQRKCPPLSSTGQSRCCFLQPEDSLELWVPSPTTGHSEGECKLWAI